MPALPNSPQKRNTFLYLIIMALIIAAIAMMFNTGQQTTQEITLNTFVEKTQSGEIHKVEVSDNRVDIELVDGSKLYTFKETGSSIYEILEKSGVDEDIIATIPITIIDTESGKFWTDLLIGIVPFLLIIAFFVFMMRSAQSSNNQAMSFGKSKAKVYDKGKQKTTFDDVAGAEEAKEELSEIVDFLKKPQKYTSIGAKIPKGVMLIGAPGTGKTLLARAIAGEADVPFFSISGSEFVEMFVGVGASRVRDLFNKAKKNAPCLIFVDEIDAVGRHRGAGMGGGHDEREQTLNQILTEMDGFETGTNIIVIAATNRPDILDPALLRPGRFDRRVVVDMPDSKAREGILKVHTRKKPLTKTVDLGKIARSTPGFTGADIENLANEAAILAAKNNKKTIGMKELEKSIEKVVMGPERKSKVLNKKEKAITAYHEVTWFLPEEDKHLSSRSKFEDEICSLLGGYTSEQMFFGEMTTGASNDLQRATKLARNMVTKYGMSDLGPIIFGDENNEVFLGKDFGHVKNYSEQSAAKIDTLVKNILDKAHAKTERIVRKHKKLIDHIATDLIKKETLTGEEFKKYFKNLKVPKKSQT